MKATPQLIIIINIITIATIITIMNHKDDIPGVADNFYDDWDTIFPQLSIIMDNLELIKNELPNIENWVPWPEEHFTLTANNTRDWKVFPFFHTFPAMDVKNSKWLSSTNSICPNTSRLLRQIPGLRTALFSRLGPSTKLAPHTGWADLSNFVLRCHIPLKVPDNNSCGITVCEETRYHDPNKVIIFDDSKRHFAYNDSRYEDRIVLIIDIIRPLNIPLGTARGKHTAELDDFIARFN